MKISLNYKKNHQTQKVLKFQKIQNYLKQKKTFNFLKIYTKKITLTSFFDKLKITLIIHTMVK